MYKIIITVLMIFALSCSTDESVKSKPVIAVTISPYEYLVQKIAGNKIEIITSIPKNATPHHYDPSIKEMTRISRADYYFRIGKYMPFEAVWVEKLTSLNSELVTVDLSKGVEYIEKDPHVWLSAANLQIIGKNILTELSRILPSDENYFETNYSSFLDSLKRVDAEISNILEQSKPKEIFVYHGSWTYFVNDYSWEQITISEGSKEPSSRELQNILNEVSDKKIPVIFTDPQHSSAAAERIAEQLNLKKIVVNPLQKNVLLILKELSNKIGTHHS